MLEPFFTPRGIAVIGASRDPYKPGYGVVRNLRDIGFPGGIYPVNPAAQEILGYRCYPSVSEVPDPVDLAVVIVAAERVIEVIKQCAARGIHHAVVSSGGFSEIGEEGRVREQALVETAKQLGMRIIGPNCIGTIDTYHHVNVTFTIGKPRPGPIGFVSQSGALCVALLMWAENNGIGFSRIASLGNQADVNETEMLAVLGEDLRTQVVTAYIEGVADGRAFMEVAERISRKKPLIVLKGGRGSGGAKAVRSHTGALAGSPEAYQAAFHRCGALQANTLLDLAEWAYTAALQPLPRGDRVAVLTNAGGAGVVAVDALETHGLKLAELSETTRARLRTVAPPPCTIANPVDVLAGSGPTVYSVALEALLADDGVDAVIVIVGPQDWFLPTSLAEVIGEAFARHKKPVLASMMGLEANHPASALLQRYHVPNFSFPDRAANALAALLQRRRWLEAPMGTSLQLHDPAKVHQASQDALRRRDLKGLLAAWGIRFPDEGIVHSADEAVMLATRIGYPVVLKTASDKITHKTEAGCVAVNLTDEVAVRESFRRIMAAAYARSPEAAREGVLVQPMLDGGYEAIVGVRRDPQFGPLVLVGSGGIDVELIRDIAIGIAPLSYVQAEELLNVTKMGRRLQGWRGAPPGDRAAVLEAVVRLGQIAHDFPQIEELEINPLYVL
ncbi:MAG: acetate--CoA ligase family protein, partial [Anaerolineae bacterium]|nr:acetate--CoA ligase family protein [Anaerolineae bacterium]